MRSWVFLAALGAVSSWLSAARADVIPCPDAGAFGYDECADASASACTASCDGGDCTCQAVACSGGGGYETTRICQPAPLPLDAGATAPTGSGTPASLASPGTNNAKEPPYGNDYGGCASSGERAGAGAPIALALLVSLRRRRGRGTARSGRGPARRASARGAR